MATEIHKHALPLWAIPYLRSGRKSYVKDGKTIELTPVQICMANAWLLRMRDSLGLKLLKISPSLSEFDCACTEFNTRERARDYTITWEKVDIHRTI